MNNEKLENLLNLALNATPEEREKSLELNIGYDTASRSWEVIVKASGGFDMLSELFPQITIHPLLNGYGILTVPAALLDALSERPEIEYMEKPKRLPVSRHFRQHLLQNETISMVPVSSLPSSTPALTTPTRISATQTAPPGSLNFGIRALTGFSRKLKSTKPCRRPRLRNDTNLSQAATYPATAHM